MYYVLLCSPQNRRAMMKKVLVNYKIVDTILLYKTVDDFGGRVCILMYALLLQKSFCSVFSLVSLRNKLWFDLWLSIFSTQLCATPFSSLKGEWILSGKDSCDSSHLYMYAIKCVNIGTSKDPFLTDVSEFAILFGNELDAEVRLLFSFLYLKLKHLFTKCEFINVSSLNNHLVLVLDTGIIDVDGFIYCSDCRNKGDSCLQRANRSYRVSGWDFFYYLSYDA